jgi:hypothetical protein
MPRTEPVGFDHTVSIAAAAPKIIGAFFDPRSLGVWWGVGRSVTTPRPLGAYALEWPRSDRNEGLPGPLGGVLHGTVIDFKPGHAFFIADLFWLPASEPAIGPMSLEVTCSSPRGVRAVADVVLNMIDPASRTPGDDRSLAGRTSQSTLLRVVQRGYEEGARWRTYYELEALSLTRALDQLKDYLERGQGIWDLRGW